MVQLAAAVDMSESNDYGIQVWTLPTVRLIPAADAVSMMKAQSLPVVLQVDCCS